MATFSRKWGEEESVNDVGGEAADGRQNPHH
jgi:hypothetical protein